MLTSNSTSSLCIAKSRCAFCCCSTVAASSLCLLAYESHTRWLRASCASLSRDTLSSSSFASWFRCCSLACRSRSRSVVVVLSCFRPCEVPDTCAWCFISLSSARVLSSSACSGWMRLRASLSRSSSLSSLTRDRKQRSSSSTSLVDTVTSSVTLTETSVPISQYCWRPLTTCWERREEMPSMRARLLLPTMLMSRLPSMLLTITRLKTCTSSKVSTPP
mmetsp:Transcript_16334/g.54695  ORF Transcript_16334/g.54695 Transcript_16334/m.54695 type:complete len:219 (+) Transcript_16334:828-1484(+)